ncbi:molybdopterin synthase sulfur carrier subunit-like [Lagopus muta]|uniref:molybdopterin synthase sulfur carrier subunit-like n=1 Tax=Lagopus muta TaxID=64668 RepID=UPI00209D1276|nr:molybdopterin synthase sulfur carrier subunit-like [Lagopus muta]
MCQPLASHWVLFREFTGHSKPDSPKRSPALPKTRGRGRGRSCRPQAVGRAYARGPPGGRGRRAADGGSMSCQVTVLYFARSAELVGLRSESVSVPQRITSLQLWEEIVKIHPRLAVIQEQVVFAVRQEYVLLGDQLLVLQTGDEVAIIPPISGG